MHISKGVPEMLAAMSAQASQCEECGHKFAAESRRELTTVAGTLQELRVEAARERNEKKQRKREQGQAQSLEQLVELGKSRGYKNPVGWARKVHAARVNKRN